MNQLPKDVIINKIIPYIESDKNREIAQLKEIIDDLLDKSIFVNKCSLCPRKIFIDINDDSDPIKYDPNVKYAVVVCRCCKHTCIDCAIDNNLHLLDTCPDCKQNIEIYPAKNIILFFIKKQKIENYKRKMYSLPKDVIVNKIIPYILGDYKKENEKLKKRVVALERIMNAVNGKYLLDKACSKCDKHFVTFDWDNMQYDKPINIINKSNKCVYLVCYDCGDNYCMDCVFKTPIETRTTHLYCPVCKHGNDCITEISQFTY